MPERVCQDNGNFSDAIWATALTVGRQSDFSYGTTLSTSWVYSSSFAGDGSEVAGVAVYLYSRAVTPSGTIDLSLRNTTDGVDAATLSINVADLPANTYGYVYFKFSTPATLTSGKNFAVGLKTSVSSQITAGRNSTSGNWTRMLVGTSTLTNITAGDSIYIMPTHTGAGQVANYTLTMDINDTSTNYGWLYTSGTCVVNYATDRNTCLRLAGSMFIGSESKFTIGTAATPIPQDYVARLIFVLTSNVQYGIECRGAPELHFYGYPLYAYTWALLNADASSGATSITVDRETGWKAGNTIIISPTGTANAEVEVRTLANDASGYTLTLSSGLSYAHKGSDNIQAAVANFDRNAIIDTSNPSYNTYIYLTPNTKLYASWAGIHTIGSSTSNKQGIVMASGSGSGLIDIQYCAFYNCRGAAIRKITDSLTNTIVFKNNVVNYNSASPACYIGTTSDAVIEGNFFHALNTSSNVIVQLASAPITFDNNYVCGTGNHNVQIDSTSLASFKGNIICCCSQNGIRITSEFANTVLGNLEQRNRIWHCGLNTSTAYSGVYITAASKVKFVGWDIYGNGRHSSTGNVYLGNNWEVEFVDCHIGASIIVTSIAYGMLLGGAKTTWQLKFSNCSFGSSSDPFRPHTQADIYWTGGGFGNIYCYNTPLYSNNKVVGVPEGLSWAALDTSTDHMYFTSRGTALMDTNIYYGGPNSVRCIPASSSQPFEGYKRTIAVGSGKEVTVSVWVRKSSSYNGNQPRLILKANVLANISEDIVLATMSADPETWEQLSAALPQPSSDVVYELVVDCSGTAGFINVADMSAEIA